eukprot:2869955-Amphidinium_carterae.1
METQGKHLLKKLLAAAHHTKLCGPLARGAYLHTAGCERCGHIVCFVNHWLVAKGSCVTQRRRNHHLQLGQGCPPAIARPLLFHRKRKDCERSPPKVKTVP